MSGEVEKITLDMQAGAVRHLSAAAPANLKPALEAATRTLAYCAKNPDLLRALAYFNQRHPMLGEIIREIPGTQIASIKRTISEPDEPDLYGSDDFGQ